MTADEAVAQLAALQAGIGERPETTRLWDAFKRFAVLPVDEVDPAEDGDRLLFEAGLGPGSGTLGVSFSRQFFFMEEGMYAGMRDVGFHLTFGPGEVVSGLGQTQIWGTGGPPWRDGYRAAEAFFEEVEATDVFRHVAARRPRSSLLDGA